METARVWGQWGCVDFLLGVQMAEIFLSRAYLDPGILYSLDGALVMILRLLLANTHLVVISSRFSSGFLILPVQSRNLYLLIIVSARFALSSLLKEWHLALVGKFTTRCNVMRSLHEITLYSCEQKQFAQLILLGLRDCKSISVWSRAFFRCRRSK